MAKKDELLKHHDREQFRKIIETYSMSNNRNQHSFGFYWTRKSVDLARTLIENYTKSSEVIFDPFMGSGSTILGSIASNGNRLAIGVEINELPIRNLQATTGMFDQTVAKELKNLESAINEIRSLYAFEMSSGPLRINKIIHDKPGDVLSPRIFKGILSNEKVEIDALTNKKLFGELSDLYFNRINQFPRRSSPVLEQNSRIAIKFGKKVSDMFGPIGFEALSRFREFDPESIAFKLILGSSIHLCRLTDLKSQSQFPYWFPKENISEKSVCEVLDKKLKELTKIVAPSSSKLSYRTYERFDDWKAAPDNGMLLIHGSVIDAEKFEIPDKSVDLVITDPPYFDQVAYSEYLKLWEYFTGFRSNLDGEIVESSRHGAGKTREAFLNDLNFAFKRIRKLMKDDAVAFIYFKDSKPRNLHDFISCLESSGLHYIFQVHLETASFTYKQNASPENTVGGDSIMVFKAGEPKQPCTNSLSQITTRENFEEIFLKYFGEYLRQNGASTMTEALDNSLIASLYPTGYLKNITSSGYLGKVANRKFEFDEATRKWTFKV